MEGGLALTTPPDYVVITIGSSGDVYPLLHIAGALQALGRKVTFITHSYHANLVQAAGLPFVGIGTDDDFLRLVANPDLWDAKKAFATLMENYGEMLEQIDQAIRSVAAQGPLVALAHPFAVPAAAISRERGGVASIVAMVLAPANMRSCQDPLTIGPTAVPSWMPMSWRRALWQFIEKGWIDPVAVAQINRARQPHGLPKVDSLLTHIAGAPDLSVTLFPSWFAPAVPDWPRPMIEGDFQLFESCDSLGQDLTAFLAAGEKPLVFTPGTANIHAADFFARALAAVNRLGRRAIFLTRERTQVPVRLHESVLWQPYVPLSALLPRAAVLIHHGGIGTTAEALRAGIPQLVTPFAWDQFDNGARIAALGAGMVIHAQRLRPRALARTLQT
ncbi:MAG: glycosyltransferase, partial [Pseudomonadota bacterium]|nr:glycosyltransferase [Pseudomonadota bacterium]